MGTILLMNNINGWCVRVLTPVLPHNATLSTCSGQADNSWITSPICTTSRFSWKVLPSAFWHLINLRTDVLAFQIQIPFHLSIHFIFILFYFFGQMLLVSFSNKSRSEKFWSTLSSSRAIFLSLQEVLFLQQKEWRWEKTCLHCAGIAPGCSFKETFSLFSSTFFNLSQFSSLVSFL